MILYALRFDLNEYNQKDTYVEAILSDEVEAELTYRMYMESRKGG